MRFLQRLARKENLLARIICLLMACGLWVYVMTDQNPIIERNIEVRLQRYLLTVFHTGSRAFTNQNVANLVAFRM